MADLNPLNLPMALFGILLAGGLWILLQVLGNRLAVGSLARALLLRSRLSLCCTIFLGSLAWWLAGVIGPGMPAPDEGGRDWLNGLILIGVVWTFLRWKGELLRHSDDYSKQIFPSLPQRERLFLIDLGSKLITTIILVIIGLQILRLLGTPTALLATAGGFGAAALGFGSRTIIENVLSGLSIYINRPFVIADLISIPSEELKGTVENIGWFYTELRDLDRQPIFVPNGIFTAKPIINSARIDNRRLWIEFGLRYGDRAKIEPIIADLQSQMAEEPTIRHDKTCAVHFVGYGASSLDMRMVCHCTSGKLPDAWNLQQLLLLMIGDVVEAHQADMPFPTRTLING
jgi:MscS family membrane protein